MIVQKMQRGSPAQAPVKYLRALSCKQYMMLSLAYFWRYQLISNAKRHLLIIIPAGLKTKWHLKDIYDWTAYRELCVLYVLLAFIVMVSMDGEKYGIGIKMHLS